MTLTELFRNNQLEGFTYGEITQMLDHEHDSYSLRNMAPFGLQCLKKSNMQIVRVIPCVNQLFTTDENGKPMSKNNANFNSCDQTQGALGIYQDHNCIACMRACIRKVTAGDIYRVKAQKKERGNKK